MKNYTLNLNDSRSENEIWSKDFDLKGNISVATRVDKITGEIVPAYIDPKFLFRLVRSKKTGEDLVIVDCRWTDTTDYSRIPKTLWPRDMATVDDIKELWPEYDPSMTREQINALKPVEAKNVELRLGFYQNVDEDGKPILDKDGMPEVTRSEKWLFCTLYDDSIYGLSGGKRKYTVGQETAEVTNPEGE